jgi:hypothetical protein
VVFVTCHHRNFKSQVTVTSDITAHQNISHLLFYTIIKNFNKSCIHSTTENFWILQSNNACSTSESSHSLYASNANENKLTFITQI